MAGITLPPDYFRSAAEKYDNTTDRKAWLIVQIQRADASLLEYQSEIILLYQEAEKLGAVFDKGAVTGINAVKGQSAIVTTVGTVLAAIPTGYTQIIGGVLILASSFFSKAENKQNIKRINDLLTIAASRISQAQQVGKYKENYESELLKIRMIPFVLVAVLIWLILK